MKIKDTTTATISDGNGQFSLTVQNSESTLIATFLGYRTHEVKITPTTDNIKITLEEDAQQLDDVVVVGYGTQKKSSLTSSVEVVRGEDLKRMPVMNVNEALVGLVAGVSVQIRAAIPAREKNRTYVSAASTVHPSWSSMEFPDSEKTHRTARCVFPTSIPMT